jgi:hypothetical protein
MSVSPAASFEVRTSSVMIGKSSFNIRGLKDKQQFSDPDGIAERAGISSSTWSLFGWMVCGCWSWAVVWV